MKQKQWIIAVVVIVAVFIFNHGCPRKTSNNPQQRLEPQPDKDRVTEDAAGKMYYRDESIKLTQPYTDFDEYKNDPKNIDPSENDRVGNLVRTAPLAKEYIGRNKMIDAVFGICFPGYGLTSFAERQEPDGSLIAGFSIEIPRAHKNRYAVFRGQKRVFTLIDDFVESEDLAIINVREIDGSLVYSNARDKPVLTRSLSKQK